MAPGEPMDFNFSAASIRASLCAYRSRSLLVLRSMRSLSLPSALMRSLKTVVACSSSDMSSNDDSLEVASKCKGRWRTAQGGVEKIEDTVPEDAGGWIVIEAVLSGRKNPALGGKTGSFPGLCQTLGVIRGHAAGAAAKLGRARAVEGSQEAPGSRPPPCRLPKPLGHASHIEPFVHRVGHELTVTRSSATQVHGQQAIASPVPVRGARETLKARCLGAVHEDPASSVAPLRRRNEPAAERKTATGTDLDILVREPQVRGVSQKGLEDQLKLAG